MLVFLGLIELPVCDWIQFDVAYIPVPKTIGIAEIKEVSPHPYPVKGGFPEFLPPCCQVVTNTGAYFCFLSYEETCKRINDKIVEFVTSATSYEAAYYKHVMEWVPPSKE